MREAFELLLGLLRRIDKGDDVIFFADEEGSWRIVTNGTDIFASRDAISKGLHHLDAQRFEFWH